MTRAEIIQGIKQYFDISELVCQHTLAKWGDKAWQFLATDYLHTLLVIRRDILRRPMYCNNPSAGTYQRGLRCNLCPLVRDKTSVYLSSHILGRAGDFTVQGMAANEARIMIRHAAHELPCNIRMEGAVSWLHIDTLPQDGVTDKVYVFYV